MRPLGSALIVSFLLLLTACIPIQSADTRVTLGANENWEGQVELVFTPEQAQLLALGQLDQALNQAVAEMKNAGAEAKWEQQERREDGNIGYLVSAQGQGLDKLNAAFFDGRAVLYVDESTGERQIVFSYAPGQAFAQKQTFTLGGGKIISSNGAQTDGRTVAWVNPTGTMEAVLTETSSLGWLPYALIGGGGVLLVIAGAGIMASVIRRRRQSSLPEPEVTLTPPPASLSAPSPQESRCANCSAALSDEAVFCPNCGTKRH